MDNSMREIKRSIEVVWFGEHYNLVYDPANRSGRGLWHPVLYASHCAAGRPRHIHTTDAFYLQTGANIPPLI